MKRYLLLLLSVYFSLCLTACNESDSAPSIVPAPSASGHSQSDVNTSTSTERDYAASSTTKTSTTKNEKPSVQKPTTSTTNNTTSTAKSTISTTKRTTSTTKSTTATTAPSKNEQPNTPAMLYLSNVKPYACSQWFECYDSVTDVFGTVHSNCIRIEKNFTLADGTYDLKKKYNTLSFTIFGLGDGNYGTLKIYADGECIYSNTNIDANTRPIDVTLDVSDVLDLKFDMYQDYNSYTGECFGLANVVVQ